MSTTEDARDAELHDRVATIMLRGVDHEIGDDEDKDDPVAERKAMLRPFQARLWAWFQEQPDFRSIEMGELDDGTVRFQAMIAGTCSDCIGFRLTNDPD